MSSATMDPAGPTAAQLETTIQEVNALQAARGRARMMTWLVLLGLLLLLGLISLGLYGLYNRFRSAEYQAALTSEAQRVLNEQSQTYMAEVEKLVQASSPVITQAFYTQAKKDLPSYLQAVQTERDALINNMKSQLEKRFETLTQETLVRFQGVLQEEFPEVKDEVLRDRLTANLTLAFEKLVRTYYVDEMNTQLLALYDAWDRFPQAELPEPGDLTLQDQFTGQLLQLLKLKMIEADKVDRLRNEDS